VSLSAKSISYEKAVEPLEEINESIDELRQSMVWFKWLLIVMFGGLVLFVLTR